MLSRILYGNDHETTEDSQSTQELINQQVDEIVEKLKEPASLREQMEIPFKFINLQMNPYWKRIDIEPKIYSSCLEYELDIALLKQSEDSKDHVRNVMIAIVFHLIDKKKNLLSFFISYINFGLVPMLNRFIYHYKRREGEIILEENLVTLICKLLEKDNYQDLKLNDKTIKDKTEESSSLNLIKFGMKETDSIMQLWYIIEAFRKEGLKKTETSKETQLECVEEKIDEIVEKLKKPADIEEQKKIASEFTNLLMNPFWKKIDIESKINSSYLEYELDKALFQQTENSKDRVTEVIYAIKINLQDEKLFRTFINNYLENVGLIPMLNRFIYYVQYKELDTIISEKLIYSICIMLEFYVHSNLIHPNKTQNDTEEEKITLVEQIKNAIYYAMLHCKDKNCWRNIIEALQEVHSDELEKINLKKLLEEKYKDVKKMVQENNNLESTYESETRV